MRPHIKVTIEKVRMSALKPETKRGSFIIRDRSGIIDINWLFITFASNLNVVDAYAKPLQRRIFDYWMIANLSRRHIAIRFLKISFSIIPPKIKKLQQQCTQMNVFSVMQRPYTICVLHRIAWIAYEWIRSVLYDRALRLLRFSINGGSFPSKWWILIHLNIISNVPFKAYQIIIVVQTYIQFVSGNRKHSTNKPRLPFNMTAPGKILTEININKYNTWRSKNWEQQENTFQNEIS